MPQEVEFNQPSSAEPVGPAPEVETKTGAEIPKPEAAPSPPPPAKPAVTPEPAKTAVMPGPAKPAKPDQPAEANQKIGLTRPLEADKSTAAAKELEPLSASRPRRLAAWSFGLGGIALIVLFCAGCLLGTGYLALQTEMGHDVAVALRLIDEDTGAESASAEAATATAEAALAAANSPLPTPTLPPTSTPTSLPPTETPIPTETSTPTPEPVETATATPVPTDTPLPTETPTPEPPPATPTPVPTEPPVEETEPATNYGPPVLLEPENDFRFIGGNTIVLRWQPVGELASDEQYAVRLVYNFNNQVTYQGANIKETEWTIPLSLYGQIDPPENRYEWFVVVERMNEDGTATAVSPESEHRTFTWK
jgi:hypothetical protein